MRLRLLPEDLPAYRDPAPVVDETYREIINIGRHNLPMVDFHVYLRPGLSLEEALRNSRNDGLQYGITAEASTLKNDDDVDQWLEPMAHRPVFFALAADNSTRTEKLSQRAARKFDYVIADVHGATMDTVLIRLQKEPIDILSGLGPVPKERERDLISVLAKNKVAVELNTVRRTPSKEFILQAKDAGCKFAFGTANASVAELKRCEYGLQTVETCKLDWHNFFTPGGWWPKAADRRWS